MHKFIIALTLSFSSITTSQAQTPTWAEDIAPILYNNCTKCHHDGGIAPFPLMEYSEATANSHGISHATGTGEMPPWPADPSYRHYSGERLLKPSEIAAIKSWADNGTPQGDLKKAPTKPIYSKDSKIGKYDLKIKIPTYTSSASTDDIYRCFSLPSNLTSTKFIEAIEIVPGNSKIVHHVLVFQDTTNVTNNLDKADPLPGYTNFGGTGSNNSILIAPYVPGSDPIKFPSGTGVKLYKKANIILQIHYPAGTAGEVDSSYVVIRFHTQPSIREVYIAPILNHYNILNGPFSLAKDQVKTFYQGLTLPYDVSLLSILPHMHLIGKSTKVFAIPPTKDTIPLIRIKNWDFHWQGEYKFQFVQRLTKGTKIQSIVTYDNTQNNPNQPSNPAKIVTLGEATTSEMMLTYFYYMDYQAGDENILQDSSLIKAGIYSKFSSNKILIYPNPANHEIFIEGIPNFKEAKLLVIDQLGRTVLEKTVTNYTEDAQFLHRTWIRLEGLSNGVYSIQMITEDGKVYHNKFIKQE